MKQVLNPNTIFVDFNQKPVRLGSIPYKPILQKGISGVLSHQPQFYYLISKYVNERVADLMQSDKKDTTALVKDLGEFPDLEISSKKVKVSKTSQKRKKQNLDLTSNITKKSKIRLVS